MTPDTLKKAATLYAELEELRKLQEALKYGVFALAITSESGSRATILASHSSYPRLIAELETAVIAEISRLSSLFSSL